MLQDAGAIVKVTRFLIGSRVYIRYSTHMSLQLENRTPENCSTIIVVLATKILVWLTQRSKFLTIVILELCYRRHKGYDSDSIKVCTTSQPSTCAAHTHLTSVKVATWPPRTTRLHGSFTSPRSRNGTSWAEDRDQALNRSPDTHTTASETQQDVESKRSTPLPALLETASPALHTTIEASGHTSIRVEALTRKSSSHLDLMTQHEHARETVREVDHEDGTDETDNAADVGNRGSDNKGENPVDRAEAVPSNLALSASELAVSLYAT